MFDSATDLQRQIEVIQNLHSNPSFLRLVTTVQDRQAEFSPSELARVFHGLKRLGLSLSDPLMQDLQVRVTNSVDGMDLSDLSLFAVAQRGRNMLDSEIRDTSLKWGLALAPTMPRLKSLMEDASSVNEVRQAAIVLGSASRIASDNIMDMFANRVIELIAQGVFDDPQTEAAASAALVKVSATIKK